MTMEGKKISFGFMKTKKAEKPVVEEQKEYIDCIDEKSIKVIGGDTVKEDVPLVIPMKPNTLITPGRLKEIAEEVEKALEEAPESGEKKHSPANDQNVDQNESIEQMAVRELLDEAKKEKKVETTALTVPVSANPVLEGERESTLDDYEAVPIQDFGIAMLRGMGWTPGQEQSKYKEPQVRPKGLGLGADKVIKENQKKNQSKDSNEELSIVKNAFVKITTGKYNGCYGKVVSLDEDNGRVMIDIPIKNEMVSLSEFMMQPVTKSEFDKESRVINADRYEEYKKSEQSLQKSSKHSSPKATDREGSSSQKYNDINKVEREGNSNNKKIDNSNGRRSRSRDRSRKRDSSSSEDRSRQRKKDKKRYNSSDSESSLSDYDRRRKHKKDRKRSSSSDSESDLYKKHKKKKGKRSKTPKAKRDIDKKRKGKKKKRDKDLSPNYKKCRK